jgi:hypothetical protein
MAEPRSVAWTLCAALFVFNTLAVGAQASDLATNDEQPQVADSSPASEPAKSEVSSAVSDVQLVTELESKDTSQVDSIAAGDEQLNDGPFGKCIREGSDTCLYVVGAVMIVGIVVAAAVGVP